MSFVRTVTGDVSPDSLGLVYAHEHLVIRGEFTERAFPDFVLADLNAICQEVLRLRELGVGTMVDAMPLDSGRAADDLVVISERTGMNVVGPTGLHLRMYYPPDHWYDTISEADLTSRFIDEIQVGMVDLGVRSLAKAGVIKVAGSLDRLTDVERRNFRAAGAAQRVTGCPILTHTEQGTAALEQIRLLQDSGADLTHVVLSHLDRNGDLGYHHEVLETGVRLEFDSAFRWGAKPNLTKSLILNLAPEFPNQITLGMDAARPSYWRSFGGKPGLDYLLTTLGPELIAEGLDPALWTNMMSTNPHHAYTFLNPN